MIEGAKKLSEETLKNFLRKSGNSYYDHACRVVEYIEKSNIQDEKTIASAYLYQILDFNKDLSEHIKNVFGNDIFSIISEYHTFSNSTIKLIKAETNNRHIVKTLLNMIEEPRVLIIRLADRTNNVRTAHFLGPERSTEIAQKALNIYAPVAHIIGLNYLAQEIENYSFRILNPERYYRISNYLSTQKEIINQAFDEISEFINEILKEHNIQSAISYRMKHIYSIHRKAISKNLEPEKVYDIAAMRIIVDTVEQCYLTESLLNKIWEYYEGDRDDYIQNPKPNGYKSIHNIYKVSPTIDMEIQIRTKEMHEYNEYGQASHTLYKLGKNLKNILRENPWILRDISVSESGIEIGTKQFSKYVYVFTPKGDIIELPKGANLIDFAYTIHADIGNGCVGGYVNGNFKGVDHLVNNGDVIYIQTTNKKPSRDWLKIVKTKKAKEQIRKALSRKR